MAYDKDKDYSLLIKAAEEAGNRELASIYEQQRNEKIADMNKSGTNTGNWQATNKYQTSTTPQGTVPTGFTGSSHNVGVNTQNQEAIRQQMNNNSMAWHTADEATRKQLERQNQQLAAQLGGTVSFDANTGYWGGQAQQLMQPTFDFNMGGKPTYESNYSDRIDAMLNQLLNREDFSYDVNTDPLYAQYKDQYNREGNRAMNDTLASVASGAGGMNSYAITAAQQANDYYSAQLGDKIPELYQLAYEMYLRDIDNQVRDLGLLQDMDDTQYNRYRDTMGDWYNDRDFAYGMYRDEVGDYWTETEFEQGNDRYEQEWEYMEQQDAYNKAMDMIASGMRPNSALMEQAGLTSSDVQAAINAQQKPTQSSRGGAKEKVDDDPGVTWDDVFEWGRTHGEGAVENYIKEHYKELGYTSQSVALAAYQNKVTEMGGIEKALAEPMGVPRFEDEYERLMNKGTNEITDAEVLSFLRQLAAAGATDDIIDEYARRLGYEL